MLSGFRSFFKICLMCDSFRCFLMFSDANQVSAALLQVQFVATKHRARTSLWRWSQGCGGGGLDMSKTLLIDDFIWLYGILWGYYMWLYVIICGYIYIWLYSDYHWRSDVLGKYGWIVEDDHSSYMGKSQWPTSRKGHQGTTEDLGQAMARGPWNQIMCWNGPSGCVMNLYDFIWFLCNCSNYDV